MPLILLLFGGLSLMFSGATPANLLESAESAAATAPTTEVRFGILAFRDQQQTCRRWQPLADFLNEHIPDHHFILECLYYDALLAAVQTRSVDFLLTNPGSYTLLARRYGLSPPLATLARNINGQPIAAFGGVIIRHAEREDLNTLNDLKGKTVAAVGSFSLGGYQMQAYELLQHGIDLKALHWRFYGMPHHNIVTAVLNHEVDAGFIRTGILEDMMASGELSAEALHVLTAHPLPGFPQLISTRLYPEWPVAALPTAPPQLSRKLLATLLHSEEHPRLLEQLQISGFDMPANYHSVEQLLQTLRMPPFDVRPDITLADIWHRYRWTLLTLLTGLILIALLLLRLTVTRHQLTKVHAREQQQRRKLQEKEAYLSSIINTEPDCIEIIDAAGYIQDLNQAGMAMLEIDALPMIQGRYIAELIDEPDRLAFERLHQQVISGHPGNLEYVVVTAKGNKRFVSTRAVPVVLNDATVHLGITRDITHEHRVRELREHLDQGFAKLTSNSFFQALCAYLAKTLQLDHVYVCEISADGQTARAVAGVAHGEPATPFSYDLVGTPCERVFGERACFFSGTVQQLFPDDHWLVSNHILSYVGVPIYHQQRGNIGLLVALSNDVRSDGESIMELLTLAAPRIGAELERQRDHLALVISEQRFHRVAENSLTFIWEVNHDGLYSYVSPEVEKVLGYQPEVLVGRKYFYDIFPAALKATFKTEVLEMMRQKQSVTGFVNPLQSQSGATVWVKTTAFPVLDEAGNLLYYAGSGTDITEQKLADDQLRLAASVFTHAHEGIMITNLDGTIIDVNNAFTLITGYARDEIVGKNPRILHSEQQNESFYLAILQTLQTQGFWSGELWNRHKNGQFFAEYSTISLVHDDLGQPWRYVAVFIDITHLKHQQERLERMALYDMLTDLPNRALLSHDLTQSMTHCRRNQTLMAVIFIDLDGFKQVNDSHGHDVGDLLLKALAFNMKAQLRGDDLLARWGGDEFVAVLPELTDQSQCEYILRRLLNAASQPIVLAGIELQVSASMGVALYLQDQQIDADQLLRQADQAMYQAKLAGRNQYYFFDNLVEAEIQNKNSQLQMIEAALGGDQFVLYYQPKVAMTRGQVIGVEALIRWQHPEQGLLSPFHFLPAIEKHALDIQLGEWVIEHALQQRRMWLEQGLDIPISINISPHHIQQTDFIERLTALLTPYTAAIRQGLQLEILESHAFANLDKSVKALQECRSLGLTLALDDFGTGYSSLSYLKHLPVNILKIDQNFVRDLLNDPDDLAILEGVIRLAEVFGLEVIAEGVETIEHGLLLLMLGCNNAQGYGIAKPMPAEQFSEWCQTWKPKQSWQSVTALDYEDQTLVRAAIQLRALALTPIDAETLNLYRWQLDTWLASHDPSSSLSHELTALKQQVNKLVTKWPHTDQTQRQTILKDISPIAECLLEKAYRLAMRAPNIRDKT
ncbi:MAG: EAL domain-containing protein [Methylococcales bacterium]|nr:EAL domain-containing protein [Methylococcales bacterium]